MEDFYKKNFQLILTYLQDLQVDLMQLIFTRKKSESKISWMIWKSWQTKLKKAKLKEALFCAMKKQMKTTQQTLSSGYTQKKARTDLLSDKIFSVICNKVVALAPLIVILVLKWESKFTNGFLKNCQKKEKSLQQIKILPAS